MPTRLGSSHVPPESGNSPIFTKAWMKLADRAASTMSHAKASVWAPNLRVNLHKALTSQRVTLGHYAVSGLEQPSEEAALCNLELTDTAVGLSRAQPGHLRAFRPAFATHRLRI